MPSNETSVYWLGINWTPAMLGVLRLLLDRCEPHGNLKPCIHCEYVTAARDTMEHTDSVTEAPNQG